MGLFKKFLGGKPDATPEAPSAPTPATPAPPITGSTAPSPATAAFDQAWTQELRRFETVTGAGPLNLPLRDPETGASLPPHQADPDAFTQWQELRAPYDHRKLLFDSFYRQLYKELSAWQTANFMVATRRAEPALAHLEAEAPPDPSQPDYAEHCAAYARALLALTREPEALAFARKAAEANPASAEVLLADALHLTGQMDAAHAVYSRRMVTAPAPQAGPQGAVEEMFRNLFSRETGAVPSPILALTLGSGVGDPAQAELFWRLAETEFYDSPHFRMHHALHLAHTGKAAQSLAKLQALVQEMPWLKEASLHLLSFFQQLDPEGNRLQPEFRKELEERVRRNGWLAV